MLGLQGVTATGNSQPLPVGSWWTLKGSVRYAVSGTGSDGGEYYWKADFTIKFLVTNKDSDTMILWEMVDGQQSCVTTYGFYTTSIAVRLGLGFCDAGWQAYSSVHEYTIVLNTLLMTAVGKYEDASEELIGHPTGYIVNVGQLTEGGKVPQMWLVPNSDAKSGHASDVDFSVGTETANVKGIQLKVWTLAYTGDSLGLLTNGNNVYSTGAATTTSLFDPLYGIFVGYHHKAQWNGNEVGNTGTWMEDYSEDAQLADASMSFTVPLALNIEPRAGAAVTVDGVNYAADNLPTVFDWVIGATHTLQVDPTIHGATGVRYVFVQWSDGSKDTSRTLTATQESSLTDTFKIQYQLTVSSDLGNTSGGWYDANTQATFSVTTPLTVEGFMGTLGAKYVFDHWSGDVAARTATASVTMDGPKTAKAEWRADNTMPYIIIGAIVAAIAIIVALLLMRRTRVPTPQK